MKVIIIFWDNKRSSYINIQDITEDRNRVELLTPRGDVFKFRKDSIKKMIIKPSK